MPTNICQVALTVANEQASIRFYSALFGMRHVFGTKSFRGRVVEKIQGIPGAASRCEWLIDDREFFQLELFRFESPASRPLPKEHPERYLGYRRLIFQVHSLDEFERQAAALGYGPIAPSRGADGLVRASMRDPDGILIELVENPADAGTSQSCRLSGVGLNVADLDRAIDSLCKGLGFELQAAREDESPHTARLRMGDMSIELERPEHPLPRPSDYRLSDIGIMNFALGFDREASFDTQYQKALDQGFTPNCKPLGRRGAVRCVYVNDPQGLSVEMLFCTPRLYGLVGFRKPGLFDRWVNRKLEKKAFQEAPRAGVAQKPVRQSVFSREIRTTVSIDAPVQAVWDCLCDFARYPDWNPMLHVHDIDPVVGGAVRFDVKLGADKRMAFRARISRNRPREALAWKGGRRSSVAGEHYFLLQERPGGGTIFVHGERFAGLLLPLAWKKLAKGERLYVRMNDALKQRAEAFQLH